jgi:hypothetical protein
VGTHYPGEQLESRWLFRRLGARMTARPKFLPGRSRPMPRTPRPESVTPEQRAEADRIYTALAAAAAADIRALADQLATTTDATIFGENEFTLRDIVHRVAANGIEIALEGRKKGGTTGRVGPATAAANRPGSSGGSPKRS